MASDKMTWFEKLRGQRLGDIELEPEGPLDPKLEGTSVRESLAKAGKNFKDLQKNAILKGLYEAAEEKK